MPLAKCLVVVALLLCAADSARAQIIYLPVQYQYGEQDKYYYGGSDPRVFARAECPRDAGGEWGRVHGYAFISGDVTVHREVRDEPVRVYSDAVPSQDAALYGYSATDAHNAAYASVTRYFRKSDILIAAKGVHGVMVVPAASAVSTEIVPQAPVAPPPAMTMPRPLMILPMPPRNPTTAPVSACVR